ncbi:MAG TPA: MraY family glycosyltransferase [Blastocatellia bacterium]|nr:MraY family glycosyltransferase [Blastocatellia bacterium]
MTLTYLAAFSLTTLVSFVLTRFIRNLAHRKQWFSPGSAHHIHSSPVPRLGGVAIYVTFILVAGPMLFTREFSLNSVRSHHTFAYILAAGTLVFLLGLLDDLRPVKPYVKFAVQGVAGVILYLGGLKIVQLPILFGLHNLSWLSLPLTLFWVLLITNAFNLIDGLDGLAAGSALFSTITVFVVSLTGNAVATSLLTIALTGAILGFLRFNFNPASIFLGDSGSLFIGFMLAALALVGSQKTPTVVAVAIPIVSFGLPLLETALSVVRRFLNGQPILTADRNHIHHKLLELGYSQRSAVAMLYGVSAAFGLLSLLLLNPGGPSVGIVLFVLGVGIWLGVQQLGYHEIFELQRVARRAMDQRKIIGNNITVRRAIEGLAKVASTLELFGLLQETLASNDFDGFQLSLSTADAQHSSRDELDLMTEDLRYEPRFVWFREGATGAAPRWSITLELESVDNNHLGFLTLYRSTPSQPIAFDFDLLVTPFRYALAAALQRILPQESREADAEVNNSIPGVIPPETEGRSAYSSERPGFAS